MSATRHMPESTRQSLMLTSMGQSNWLENIAGDNDVDDDYHCDPLTLLERREEQEANPNDLP